MTTEEKKGVKGDDAVRKVFQVISQKAIGQDKPPSEKDDEGYYDKQIRRTRARRELEEEERRLKELDKQPEPPFQVRGGIDIGTIDVQEERRRRENELESERQAAAQRAQEVEAENKRLQQELYQERIESLRRDFSEKFEELQRAAQSGNQKNFTDQYNEVLTIAKELGLEKTGAGQDPMIQLELAKLNYQQSREEREFKWKMREDEKKWQLDMEKLKDEREFRRAELAQQAKKDEMFASFPQLLGGAIARGIMDGEGNEGEQPAPERKIQKESKRYHIEVDEGESGEIECPECHSPVVVAPSTKTAVCLGCNSKFDVVRKPQAEGVPAGTDSEYQQDEEE